ncbi:MAG TPA: ComEC/Rec2 family competence protein [Candidatus Saccharimonadales bacterium]|nr:ComEC/Rec2 family competence protein [Candidatus Saccharimonadales bacterium]
MFWKVWSGKQRLRRATLVCGACVGLFAGVGLAYWRVWPWAWVVALAMLPLLWWARRRHGWTMLALLLVGFFALGWWRGSVTMTKLAPYRSYPFQKITVQGRAASDGVFDAHSQLTFDLGNAHMRSPAAINLPGELRIGGFGLPMVRRGDVVSVSGKLYPGFGGSQGSIRFATLKLVSRSASPVDSLRRRFAAGMQSALPEPQASFGMGLLIGQKSTLPPDVAQMLLTVGLTHIIAVSGYNLTVIVEVVRRLLANRSKYQTAAGCVVLILLFLAITGNSPSIVRAAIISMLSIVAWYYGRTIRPLALLCTAGAITVLANPLYLWGNASWYLSFLAFFGVVVVAPLVVTRVGKGREPNLLLAIVIESLCAELMTLPYVLHTFGQMSLVGLPANVLVVALVPLAMLLCLIAGLAGVLVPLAAGWLAWPAKLLLTYMLDVASLLSRIPRSFVDHLSFSAGYMLALYALGAILLCSLTRRVNYAILTDKKQLERQRRDTGERTQQMVDD